MVSELPTVNRKVGLQWCHMYVEGSSESGGKWLKLITYTCGQCSSDWGEAVQHSENLHKTPSQVMQWLWVCGLRLYGTGERFASSEDSCLAKSTGHCCLHCSVPLQLLGLWLKDTNRRFLKHTANQSQIIMALAFATPFHIADEKWDCALICYRTVIFWCFSMWYFLFPSVRASAPERNLLPNLTWKVHFYHPSNEDTFWASSELATAN